MAHRDSNDLEGVCGVCLGPGDSGSSGIPSAFAVDGQCVTVSYQYHCIRQTEGQEIDVKVAI